MSRPQHTKARVALAFDSLAAILAGAFPIRSYWRFVPTFPLVIAVFLFRTRESIGQVVAASILVAVYLLLVALIRRGDSILRRKATPER
ncbi:MAG: hypothetical protein R3C15_20840 [Thermoleophilia bacterium]